MSHRRDKVPTYNLSRRILPLVYYPLRLPKWLGFLKCSLWSSECMLEENYFIKSATGEMIMKQILSPSDPQVILLWNPKLVASPRPKFLVSWVFQACRELREALTWEGPTGRGKCWLSQYRMPAFGTTVAVTWQEAGAQATHPPFLWIVASDGDHMRPLCTILYRWEDGSSC